MGYFESDDGASLLQGPGEEVTAGSNVLPVTHNTPAPRYHQLRLCEDGRYPV
jgi:hypothetical protein